MTAEGGFWRLLWGRDTERLLHWAERWPDRIWAVEGASGLGHLLALELGLNAALPPVYELRASIAEFGRGERA